MVKLTKSEEADLIEALMHPPTQRKAYERLVRLYSEPLYWQVRRMVVGHEDADDVVQNTFIKAWQHLDQFRAESRISTWLYRIAYNESLAHLQKEKKHMGMSVDDPDGVVANQLESDAYFEGDEMQMKFQEALSSLPAKQKQVFNMKYFDDMKYDQIADILGTSVGGLKASYHHAVQKIKAVLQGE